MSELSPAAWEPSKKAGSGERNPTGRCIDVARLKVDPRLVALRLPRGQQRWAAKGVGVAEKSILWQHVASPVALDTEHHRNLRADRHRDIYDDKEHTHGRYTLAIVAIAIFALGLRAPKPYPQGDHHPEPFRGEEATRQEAMWVRG